MGELSEVEAQGVSNGVCSVRFPAVDATTDWLPCEKDLKFNDIVCLCLYRFKHGMRKEKATREEALAKFQTLKDKKRECLKQLE